MAVIVVAAGVVVVVVAVAHHHHRPHRSEVHDQAEHDRVRGPDDRVDPMRRRGGGEDGSVGLARLRRKTAAAADAAADAVDCARAADARPLADRRRSFAHTAHSIRRRGGATAEREKQRWMERG